ncbi:MAG: hypothetical protein NT150_11250 [Bacteroidetes bacterium]|nr:hypothetical protein [Bacteroidota bacterium]
MNKFLWSIFALLPALHCCGQDAAFISHSAAICNYSLNSNDVWSSTCNPAGLSEVKKFSCGLFYYNQFLMKEVSSQYLACAFPFNKNISGGITLFRFGNNDFSKNKISVGAGLRLTNHLQLGAQLHYEYVHQSEQNSLHYACPELGMTYRISNKLSIASSIFNFTSNLYNNHKLEENQLLRIGLSYYFDDKVKVHAQVIFENKNYPFVAVGIDYLPKEKIYVGINISSTNQPFNIGVGYKLKPLEIKIAFAYHQLLGVSPASAIML